MTDWYKAQIMGNITGQDIKSGQYNMCKSFLSKLHRMRAFTFKKIIFMNYKTFSRVNL